MSIFHRVYRYLRESYDCLEYDKVICTCHMYSNALKTKIILCYDHLEKFVRIKSALAITSEFVTWLSKI